MKVLLDAEGSQQAHFSWRLALCLTLANHKLDRPHISEQRTKTICFTNELREELSKSNVPADICMEGPKNFQKQASLSSNKLTCATFSFDVRDDFYSKHSPLRHDFRSLSDVIRGQNCQFLSLVQKSFTRRSLKPNSVWKAVVLNCTVKDIITRWIKSEGVTATEPGKHEDSKG